MRTALGRRRALFTGACSGSSAPHHALDAAVFSSLPSRLYCTSSVSAVVAARPASSPTVSFRFAPPLRPLHPTPRRDLSTAAHKATATGAHVSRCCWRCGHALPADHSAAASVADASASAASPSPRPTAAPSSPAPTAAASAATAAPAGAHGVASAPPANLFCSHCHTLQLDAARSKPTNYYHVFHLPLRYDVSLTALEASYKSLQKSLHPDRFHGAAQVAQHTIASQLSAFVNSAYVTLKSPYERAVYLLSLYGVEIGEGTASVTDPTLLMEIMETRESLEEAHTPAELQTFARHNLSELKRVQQSIAHAFAAGDLTAMRQHTIRLSFLTTIEEEIYRRMPVL